MIEDVGVYPRRTDDGTYSVEFIDPNGKWRIGLWFDPEDAGWYFVSKNLEESACGAFKPEVLEFLKEALNEIPVG